MNNECNEFFLGVGEQGSRRKLKNFTGAFKRKNYCGLAFKEKIVMDFAGSDDI